MTYLFWIYSLDLLVDIAAMALDIFVVYVSLQCWLQVTYHSNNSHLIPDWEKQSKQLPLGWIIFYFCLWAVVFKKNNILSNTYFFLVSNKAQWWLEISTSWSEIEPATSVIFLPLEHWVFILSYIHITNNILFNIYDNFKGYPIIFLYTNS